jgi:tetratricopeptide (TPR) repeat protein
MSSSNAANQRLAVVVFADIVGYSLYGQEAALQVQAAMQDLVREGLQSHRGRLVNTMGDGFMAEFPAACEAVHFALELQTRVSKRSLAPRFRLRVGMHFGDVVARGDQIDGTNVVIAARAEPLASTGGVCMTQPVWEQVRDNLPRPAVRLGKLRVKGSQSGLCFYHVYSQEAGLMARMRHRAGLFFKWPGRVPAALLAGAVAVAVAIWLRPFASPLVEYVFPPAPARLVLRATKLLERFDLEGNVPTAIGYLQKAIDHGAQQSPPPDWMSDARAWLAFAYWRRALQSNAPEDRQKALEQSATATNALNPLAYQIQGLVVLKQGEITNAVSLLTRANELYLGQNCDVLVKLAEARMLLHRPEEAAADLASAYAVVRKPWNAYITLGRYEYIYATNAWSARTNFEQALCLAPDSPLAWNNLAGVMVHLDQPAQALKAMDALSRKFPAVRQNPEFCSAKGSIFLDLTNTLAAAQWFLSAAELRPADHRFWGNAGIALREDPGQRAKSRECFRKALQLAQLSFKDNPSCLTLAQTGLYQAGLDLTNNALAALSEAVRQCPNNSQVHAVAAEGFRMLGTSEQFQQFFEQIQKTKATTPDPPANLQAGRLQP